MTLIEARNALKYRRHVEAGSGADHDTGHIVEIDGTMATIAWDSGVRTPHPIDDLELVEG